jgi:hypothetical protein
VVQFLRAANNPKQTIGSWSIFLEDIVEIDTTMEDSGMNARFDTIFLVALLALVHGGCSLASDSVIHAGFRLNLSGPANSRWE